MKWLPSTHRMKWLPSTHRMKWLSSIIIALLVFSTVGAVTERDIPSLTNYHQFYGRITGLPATGSFTLRLQAGTGSVVTTAVASDGKYGYAEVVKVAGTAGDKVVFTVVTSATGAPVRVGEEPYVGGKVQNKELNYGVSPPLPPPSPPSSPPETSPDSSPGRRSRDRDRDSTVAAPTGRPACLQSWDCSIWTVCAGGSQTRTCIRSDTCDAQLTRREVSGITPIGKPLEQQSCSGAAGTVVCPTNSKRCVGNNLQQCSTDGATWITVESCPQGCNPVTFSCRTAPVKTVVSEPPIPWVPIGAGAGGLILIIAIVLIVLHLKKSGSSLQPVREYIFEAKRKGFSDEVIKMKLVAQGWDAEKIEKVLRKG